MLGISFWMHLSYAGFQQTLGFKHYSLCLFYIEAQMLELGNFSDLFSWSERKERNIFKWKFSSLFLWLKGNERSNSKLKLKMISTVNEKQSN